VRNFNPHDCRLRLVILKPGYTIRNKPNTTSIHEMGHPMGSLHICEFFNPPLVHTGSSGTLLRESLT
jgi:hypothetical protein